jgi:hypothetical protein
MLELLSLPALEAWVAALILAHGGERSEQLLSYTYMR